MHIVEEVPQFKGHSDLSTVTRPFVDVARSARHSQEEENA